MKGILMRPEVWAGKKRVLEQTGLAVTRRVIKPQPSSDVIDFVKHGDEFLSEILHNNLETGETEKYVCGDIQKRIKPRYQVGETVYIKEVWCTEGRYDDLKPSELPNDAKIFFMLGADLMNIPEWVGRLRSPLHLPERFARHFVQITANGPERLQEITEEDAIKEGVPGIATKEPYPKQYRDSFESLWDSINPKYPFESKPWVFRYEFQPTGRHQEFPRQLPERVNE